MREDTLIVFVSDSHIGGDPGCDGFESPEELKALFAELDEREGPVELVLAGDFFDFLQIGSVPDGEDRASLTIARPEYGEMFEALKRFKSGAGKRVIYLPGNHDAESFWNPKIQETLRERGLVDEFAFSYLACMKPEGKQRIIYCEHGNQFDPENTVEVLDGKSQLPMNPFPRPTDIDIFVSGHTHLPSLTELKRPHGGRQVMVNSGCWLRQLQPIKPHLNGPPVFVSKFVLTHVRVFARDAGLCVELWEHPKPAEQRLTRLERLLSWNRRPPQPSADSKPRPLVASTVK